MLAALRAFAVLCVVGVVALVALLALNVIQLSRTGKPQVIVITATPQPMTLAQAAAPTSPPLSGMAALPSVPLTVAVTATPVGTATTAPTATPAATATTVPTATPAPSPTPQPKPGEVMYQADWTTGMNGWSGSKDWKYVSGMIVDDGSVSQPSKDTWIVSPYQPKTADYALEVEIQTIAPKCGKQYGADDFGIIARATNDGAIVGGYHCAAGPFRGSPPGGLGIAATPYFTLQTDTQAYPQDAEWHTYRLEIKGNTMTLLLDGTKRITVADNTYLVSGKVGLFSNGAQISVRSFKVIAL